MHILAAKAVGQFVVNRINDAKASKADRVDDRVWQNLSEAERRLAKRKRSTEAVDAVCAANFCLAKNLDTFCVLLNTRLLSHARAYAYSPTNSNKRAPIIQKKNKIAKRKTNFKKQRPNNSNEKIFKSRVVDFCAHRRLPIERIKYHVNVV